MDVDGMMAVWWWLEGLTRRKYLISALEMLPRCVGGGLGEEKRLGI